jgi:hypothetical protein
MRLERSSFARLMTVAVILLLATSFASATNILYGQGGVPISIWHSTSGPSTITTYTGSDDGASTSGPWPLSAAAQTLFLAAAGPTGLIDFESQPVGYNTPFTAAPGVTVALTGPNFGSGFSGISNTTFGNLYGFNTTSGGSQWLGFAEGTATFSFASPITAFGMWITGVQTVFTSSFTLTFNDGTAQSLNLPINVNGGTSYFGFTDTSSFSSLTITNLSNDAWGIDDVSYSTASAVPEPSTLLMFGSGLVGLAGIARRRFTR